MKILFIAPRFHTNQSPIVNNLIKSGHKVEFFAQYVGKTEDHSIIQPCLMKHSIISKIIYKIVDVKYDENTAEKKKVFLFIPSIFFLYKRIRNYKPDIVILRGTFNSIVVNFICKIMRIKCLYYNQSPLYFSNTSLQENRFKSKYKRFIQNKLLPKARMTPVYVSDGNELLDKKKSIVSRPHSYFVPLIAEKNGDAQKRSYCKDGYVNILSVGKYRDYKNHFLLVDAIKLLKHTKKIRVKIVGQAANKEEQKYYEALKQYITKKNLQDIIKLEKNIDYKIMGNIYLKNDIFVLTSKKEVASVAVLEAMAHGLVTISTDMNGTASYIENGIAGYIFKTMNPSSLAEKIENLIEYKEKIKVMGRAAYKNICYNYSFSNYYNALDNALNKEFNISLIEKN